MSKHTVAIMGLGVRGKIHLRGLLENSDSFEVVGMCNTDVPAMEKVAGDFGLNSVPRFTDAEQMLATVKPEVFVFVTYPCYRLSLIELGVKYGVKAISLEKPMAESLLEAKTMKELCHEHGIKAIVCHQQKYLSQMKRMKQRIEDGEIGEIRKIHVETQPWFSQLGTHYVDYTLWINGGYKAKWVVGHVHGPATLADSHPAPDYLMGTMELENGVRAYIECGYLSEAHSPSMYASSDNRLTVYGTDGYVYAETDGFWGACTKATDGRLITGKDPGWRNHQQVPIQTPYYTEFAAWLDDDLKPHSCNIDIAYHGYEILEGMCLSALNNTRVDIPITNFDYPPVFEQMKTALPPCGTELRKLYDGKVPRKERD
jgi:predicted dehydrogenase